MEKKTSAQKQKERQKFLELIKLMDRYDEITSYYYDAMMQMDYLREEIKELKKELGIKNERM